MIFNTYWYIIIYSSKVLLHSGYEMDIVYIMAINQYKNAIKLMTCQLTDYQTLEEKAPKWS